MPERTLRISPVGLRGVVGRGLSAAHVLDFAAAFGTFLGPGKVIVGRDPRSSGVMIREGVVSGLLATGHDVIDLGVVSTPVIQHSITRLGAAGGISIGASHNAAEWSALKFFGARGAYLSSLEAEELLDIYHLKKFSFGPWTGLGRLSFDSAATDLYLDGLARDFDLGSVSRYRILVDSTNGTSGPILRRMNERFGTGFILINEPVEGRQFAHEPATTRKMAELQLAPLAACFAADAGFLFDIDSDRVTFVTETGEAPSEEMVLVLLADHLLELRGAGFSLPEQPRLVLANVSSTALLDEVAARHGGSVVRIAVGRQAAIDAIAAYPRAQLAVLGEGTGAVMMPRAPFVYDGIASMLAILEMMSRRNQTLGQIVAGYPAYSILKGRIPLETGRVPELFEELEQRYPDATVSRLDGLRLDFPGRWVHVRVSQTEPLVRVIAEQRGDPPQRLFDDVMDLVRSYMS
jgi:phosphomannomutase